MLEVLNAIELALTNLKLKDCFGEPLEGLMALPPVARFHGRRWDEAELLLEQGQSLAYCHTALILIREFKEQRKAIKQKGADDSLLKIQGEINV